MAALDKSAFFANVDELRSAIWELDEIGLITALFEVDFFDGGISIGNFKVFEINNVRIRNAAGEGLDEDTGLDADALWQAKDDSGSPFQEVAYFLYHMHLDLLKERECERD